MAIDPNHTAAAANSTTATATRPIRPAPSPAAPHSLVYAATHVRAQSASASSPVAGAAPPQHHHLQGQGVLYPVASSGRGFIPRPIRPASAEHTVTVANAGGGGGGGAASYASRAHINYPPPQQQHLPMQLMRPPYSLAPSPVRGLPLSSAPPPEVAPPSSVPESNGFKDIRDKSRDENLAVIRGRKVRLTDRASLYVHCRSWLRNGFPEEIQPQYGDAVRSLPKPSPIPRASVTVPKEEEGEVEEKEEKEQDNNKDKDEECVEHLSTDDLLKEHVKRARKVRARLREERLVRIERYKTRLALLLPPVGEQFRNDQAAGN